jgi:hypothetical protein
MSEPGAGGFERALEALHGPLVPLTDDDLAERRTLIAREYARREARLRPSPQLDLDAAA